MVKIQHIFQSLIVLSLLLGLSAQPFSALAWQAEGAPAARQNAQEIPDTYELVAENETFQLYANRETLAFKVLDRRSGYVWHSNLDEVTKEDKLNKTWTAFASSGISIDYLDQKAISKRASITNTEKSIDFKPTGDGFDALVNFLDPSITLLLSVRLEPAGVSVEIPFASIQEDSEDFKLGGLHVYPFLGATKEDLTPGYMFIPDGSGSLIHFNAETKAKNMFYGKYYGVDLGMITYVPFDPRTKRSYRISVPVFGMVHGVQENAYISIVEKGASYGEITAHPAGVTTIFNFIYTSFTYNQSYFQATNRSGAGVTTLQQNTNQFDVKIHYRFLAQQDADYVGMARSYQQYLVDKGDLKRVSDPDKDIGLKLEFLGGEKEKVLFWQRSIPMTTVEQMQAILSDLEAKNLEVVYYGWQPLGASTMPPKTLKIEPELGSLGDLRGVVQEITGGGGSFHLYYDPQAALMEEKGYSPRYDLAMSITNFNLVGFNRNKVNFYLNLNAIRSHFASLSQEVYAETGFGLAVDSLGSMLYSDFKRGNFLNREQAMASYQALLQENPGPAAFYTPNDYMYPFMQAYYDMPINDSGYIYTHETVPFLQIVLAGYVPYYGNALNFSSDMQDDLLRHADSGVYPAYFLTQEVTAKILNTDSSWIYTSAYSQWEQEIKQTYQWLNALLAPVKGQTIEARKELATGVYATTYSNGKHIIVNYNDEPYTAGESVVNGKDAVIVEVLP
ncbi:MAG: DUF5696 domain-containing protein [Anaerolineales bacterium]|nr:DUF5696 domain-containing protein [Anaerolineales bacterium]